MKKTVAFMLAAISLLTACGSGKPDANTNGSFDYKTGLATYTHTNDTYGYNEGKNGQSYISTTIVAAVFDDAGKIIDISIDEVENKTGFDNTGQLVGYTGNEVKSKKEMGDAYGMKVASGIGKEWYQQIETLEKHLIGKDINTVISSGMSRIGSMNGTDNGYMGNGVGDDYPDNGMDNGYGMWNGAGYDNWNNNNMTPRNNTNNGDNIGSIVGDVIDGVGDAIDNAADNIMGDANSASNNMATGSSSTTNSGTTYSNNSFWNSSDITAGVTIDTTYIQRAIEKAYRNSK